MGLQNWLGIGAFIAFKVWRIAAAR